MPPPPAPSRPTTCSRSCAIATSPAPAPRSSSSASAPPCPADRPPSRCAPARRSCPPPSTSTDPTAAAASCCPPLDTTRQGKLRDDVQRVTQDLAHALEELIRRAPEQWHLLQPNWPIATSLASRLRRPAGLRSRAVAAGIWCGRGCGWGSSRRSPRRCRARTPRGRPTAGIDEMVADRARTADRLGFDHLTCSEHVAVPPADADGARRRVLGSAGHARLPGRAHRADPPRHLRAGARLPPPARAGQALRHPRPHRRRPARARRGRRHAGAGVRAARGPDAAARRTRRRRPPRAAGVDGAERAWSTTARTTTSRTSWWSRTPSTSTCRSGSAAGLAARSQRAVELGDGWAPFGLERRRLRRVARRGGAPDGFEVVAQPGAVVDPIADPSGSTSCSRSGRAPAPPSSTCTSSTTRSAHYLEQLDALAS